MAKYSITLMTDVVVDEHFVVGNVGDDVMYKLTESQVVSILEDALSVISSSAENMEQSTCVDCITRIEDDDEEDDEDEEDGGEEEGDEYDDSYEDEGE